MNNDFRQRVFLPVIMPIGVVLGFIGFAFMLSRVLLAVPEFASTFIALGLAAYILLIAGLVSARPRITSRALAVGVTLGLLGVLAAGMIAASAGMRELEHAEAAGGEHGGEGEAPAGGEASEGGGSETAAFEWVAIDISFESAPETTKAGKQTITLINNGQAPHNVTFPDLGEDPVVEAEGGQSAEAEINLKPGTYEYICSVPGHEATMNGTLTVE
jgi:plastocyanin